MILNPVYTPAGNAQMSQYQLKFLTANECMYLIGKAPCFNALELAREYVGANLRSHLTLLSGWDGTESLPSQHQLYNI